MIEWTRRLVIGGTAALACAPALGALADALQAARRDVVFDVWRNGARIGTHRVSFRDGDRDFVASIDAQFLVKLGPIPLFHYHHQAQETWRGGQFAALQSHTDSNGKQEHVSAVSTAGGVAIVTGNGRLTAPAGAHPLTHWNPAVLEGPLFNPQTGAPLSHEVVTRSEGQSLRLPDGRVARATRYTLTGDGVVIDWYVDGAWAALRGKLKDGSWLDYRRSA